MKRPLTASEMVNLHMGIMDVPFDVVAEGTYLHNEFIGAKRITTPDELASWVAPTLDIPAWHRSLQIDFTKSTVIGVSAGYRTGTVHPIRVTSMTYNAKENQLRVEIAEDLKTDLAVTLTQHLRPYQIVKCLNTGDASIFFNVKETKKPEKPTNPYECPYGACSAHNFYGPGCKAQFERLGNTD